jgi:divalent metal cation (Fe/Co/Zn/Cd) transporter
MKRLWILASAAMFGAAAFIIWSLWPRLLTWYTEPPFATEKLIGLGLMLGIAILTGVSAYVIASKEPNN